MLLNVAFVLDLCCPPRYNRDMESYFSESPKDPNEVKSYLAAEKLTIKEFAKMIKCTPQHLSGVLSGRLPFAESLREKIGAEISRRNSSKFSDIAKEDWLAGCYTLKVRFTSWEWHNITEHIPSTTNLEEKIRDYVLFELLSDIGGVLIEKEKLPPRRVIDVPPPQE